MNGMSIANLQKYLLIQALAFQVTAAGHAAVYCGYHGASNAIMFDADPIDRRYLDSSVDRLYPSVILSLGVHDDDHLSSAFDRFISFLNSLLSEPVDDGVVAIAHQTAFTASQISLL